MNRGTPLTNNKCSHCNRVHDKELTPLNIGGQFIYLCEECKQVFVHEIDSLSVR